VLSNVKLPVPAIGSGVTHESVPPTRGAAGGAWMALGWNARFT
jgi:hypothetical protein